VGHVFVRLSGYQVRLVPYWPYRFARVDADPSAVEVTRWTASGPATAVVDPTHPSPVAEVVDIQDGPSTGSWRIETSVFTALWPDGFTIESSQDAADHTLFYLLGAERAAIFPQGPLPVERVPAAAGMGGRGRRWSTPGGSAISRSPNWTMSTRPNAGGRATGASPVAVRASSSSPRKLRPAR
jgi:hypothetical protein